MKEQILDLEKKYWEGMQNHNYDVVKNLTYFPCTVVSKKGIKSIDEPTFKEMFDSGKDMKMKIKGISEAVVQSFSKSFATIAYIIEMDADENGQNTLHKCVCTSSWIMENGVWKCATHSESDLA